MFGWVSFRACFVGGVLLAVLTEAAILCGSAAADAITSGLTGASATSGRGGVVMLRHVSAVEVPSLDRSPSPESSCHFLFGALRGRRLLA
jgi:hypothetical protein